MSLLKKYREFSASRKDTEDKQAIVRVAIIASVLIYSVLGHLSGDIASVTVVFVAFVFLFSIGILAHIFLNPEVNDFRRYVGIFHDPLVVTWFLHLAEGKAALYLFVYTWVAVGNGFRYGPKYLYVSAFLGSIGFSSLLILDSYWATHWYFGLGVLITIVAVTGYTGMLLSQLKRAKEKLEEMATRDHLTGLANRAVLIERIQNSLAVNGRHRRDLGAVYFDLDGFKKVNDSLGHKAGDELLIEVARRVRNCIRNTDTFARIGGDEFVVILDTVQNTSDVQTVCERILFSIRSINSVGGREIKISSSLGVVHISGENVTAILSPEVLIKMADEQMYKAKKSGKNRVEYLKLEAA